MDLKSLYYKFWYFIRGVDVYNWRKLCTSCGQTGQAHIPYSKCMRMKVGS